MKISGKKGYFRYQDPDTKMSKDGKEIILEGKWHKVYAEVAPAGDDVYVPVVEEENGLTMMRFKDLTLEVKVRKMENLGGQKISFMRYDPDIDITKPEDPGTRFKRGEYRKRPGRIGFDVSRIHLPLITTTGERLTLSFDKLVFEEKSKGDK